MTETFDFPLVIIGFCFGGMCALDIARINVPGVLVAVSFHGSLDPLADQPNPEKEPNIEASVLVCHGDADTHIPQEQVKESIQTNNYSHNIFGPFQEK